MWCTCWASDLRSVDLMDLLVKNLGVESVKSFNQGLDTAVMFASTIDFSFVT